MKEIFEWNYKGTDTIRAEQLHQIRRIFTLKTNFEQNVPYYLLVLYKQYKPIYGTNNKVLHGTIHCIVFRKKKEN